MTATDKSPALFLQIQKYFSSALLLAVGIGAAFMLCGYTAIAKGLILGTLFSIINFFLLARSLPAKIGHTRKRTWWLSTRSRLVRFSLLAIPMLAAIKSDAFNLAATVTGLFIVQLLVLANHILSPALSRLIKSDYSGGR